MNRNHRIFSTLRDSRAKRCEPGFTIVELLVVIVVIGILASITVIGYNMAVTNAAEVSLRSDLENASARLKQYHQEKRAYPASINDIDGGLRHSDDNTLTYVSNGFDFCVAASTTRDGIGPFYVKKNGTVGEGACPALDVDEGPAVPDVNDEAPSSVSAVCAPGAPTPSGYILYDATGMTTVSLQTAKEYIVKNTASVTTLENSGAGDLIFCGQDITHAVTYEGGGSGDKLIFTGSGNDTFSVDSSNATLVSGGGADVIDVSGPGAVVYAGAGNDTVTFGGASSKIYGGSGSDTISGSGGNAMVWGGLGADTINATGAGSVVYED